MSSGYPKMVSQGSKNSFVFRFEKFNGTVFYDPAVDVTSSSGTPNPTTDVTTTGSSPTGAGAMIKASPISVIMLLFIFRFFKLL